MNSLYFHHLKTLSLTFFTFLSLMVLLLVIGSAAEFLALAVENGLSLFVFFRLLMSLIPAQISSILPLCILAAAVATFTNLTNASEFSVLRAAGIGEQSYFQPALIFGAVIALMFGTLNLYIAPLAEQNLLRIERESQALVTQNTVINAQEPISFSDFEIYVNKTDQARLTGASFFRQSDKGVQTWHFAESAEFISGPNGLALLLEGSRLFIFADRQAQSAQTLGRILIDLGLDQEALIPSPQVFDVKAQTLSQLLDMASPSDISYMTIRQEIFERGAYIILVFAMPSWILFWLLWTKHARGHISLVAYIGPASLIVIFMAIDSFASEAAITAWHFGLGWGGVSLLAWFGPLYFKILNHKKWMSWHAHRPKTI